MSCNEIANRDFCSPRQQQRKRWKLWGSSPRPFGMAPVTTALERSAQLSCRIGHGSAGYDFGMSVATPPTATWQCIRGKMVGVKHMSLHWGLNPGPSVYKNDALPLSYRGICRTYLRPQQFPNTLPTPKVPRSLPKGPAIGSTRRRRLLRQTHSSPPCNPPS